MYTVNNGSIYNGKIDIIDGMELKKYITSEGFFSCSESLSDPEMASFDSVKGRLLSFARFIETGMIVPISLGCKLLRTFFRGVGVVFMTGLLVASLFSSSTIRELFVRRVKILAEDLADWVLWPVAVVSCLGRLLLAAFVHPALYFGF